MSDAEHEPTHRPLPKAGVQEQATPAQEYRAAVESLFERAMTEEEAACFRREMASDFVPLTSTQTRILPPRVK